MATVRILTIPQGSQFTSRINTSATPPEPDSKNDFRVLLVWDENVTNLKTGSLSATNGTIISVDGENSVYEVVVRPPENATTITFIVEQDAVTEGNPRTELTIRVSTAFPDSDADEPTQLFTTSSSPQAIAVSPTNILLRFGNDMRFYTHVGTEETSKEIRIGAPLGSANTLDYFNESIIYNRQRYPLDSTTAIATYLLSPVRPVIHTSIGIMNLPQNSTSIFRYLPYGKTESADVEDLNGVSPDVQRVAHQDGLLILRDANDAFLARITDEPQIEIVRRLNIKRLDGTIFNPLDIAIYQDRLYITETNKVTSLDIRPYRPMATNTKTTIYPVFANEGDTIDMTQYAPDAKEIVFDTGFDKPSYLSTNTNNELVIASSAVSETTPVLVKLRGINYIDSTPFEFYLIIENNDAPVWREVDDLTMRANATFDMHQIVDADSIALQSGPTGSSISNGVFTIGTTSGDATFRATKNARTTDTTITITVVQTSDPANFSDNFKYRTEIAGIDVSEDVLISPRVSVSSDAVQLNEYVPNEITLTLKSDNRNGYKYTDGITNNFWAANNLNPTGFRAPIRIFIDSEVGGSTVSHLLFSGIILQMHAPIGEATARVECVDITEVLRKAPIENFGVLEKWDALRQGSDEATYQGSYLPESALTPIQFFGAAAWEDRQALTLRDLPIPPEGPPIANTAYLTNAQLLTSGGFLDESPLLRFKSQPRHEDVRFLVSQLGLNGTIYNTEIDLPPLTVENPYILNRGSVPYSVENTRTTRLLKDWVYDSTNDRVLMLLSNPENHIADAIVQYNVSEDSYRTLHTFDRDVKAHRIARRTATDYYILTSDAIIQDRSAATLPRAIDKTALAYDSVAEGSRVRIHRYNASTNTLTEHVAEDNARPPQLARHYWIGFENEIYIDEFEGLTADDRGAFKFQGSNLYYRYATDSEFGVARVGTNGTTTERIDQARGEYWDHVNFAFDVDGSDNIYFVYAVGDTDDSSLVVKRLTSGGTESTLLTDTEDLEDLTVLDDTGGAYLGAYEVLFHNNFLYILAPIQRVDEDSGTYTRSREKSAGMVLYRMNTTGTPALTALETYDYVQRGACNLTVYDGNVHFLENPPAATQFRPINPDLDGYWSDAAETQTLGYNVLPTPLGALKRISASGDVESLGNLQYTDRPYNVAATRCISFDGDLHVSMGYGDLREVLRFNSGAAKTDNVQHLVYTEKLRYVLPEFTQTGRRYTALADLAMKTNATLSFENGLIVVRDRRPFRAETDGATGTGTGNLDFTEANKTFPSSGYLKIGKEFIQYTGISSGAFTGITRGVLGTSITNHADETEIVYMNHVIDPNRLKQESFQFSTLESQIFNIIENNRESARAETGTIRVKDEASIQRYGDQPYSLELGLTAHETAWTETVFQAYLAEFSELQQQVRLTLKPTNYLQLGQVVGLRYDVLVYALQIVDITYGNTETVLRVKSV